ncbi:hypothetical protein BD413DRAFT_607800 [Trametes elegans]|nr:hypothetical protein BD413DRAFT_607800 [Trametes elegans]
MLRTLLAISAAAFVSADARPLYARANSNNPDEEETGPDGHLTEPWVVAVAATLAVVICAVAGIILLIKWRQARRRRAGDYGQTADDLREGRRSPPRPYHGPYGFHPPSSRTPSPPTPAHLSEKTRWAPLPPQR